MKFQTWLITAKGLALKTAKLYSYYALRISNFEKEYNKQETGSKKRLMYFSYKYLCEYMGYTFPNVDKPKKVRDKIMRYITYDEYMNIVNNYISNNSENSINGKLIAEFAFIYGLRINEILNLKHSNIKLGKMTIKGKGGKVRILPISNKIENISKLRKGYVITNKNKKLSYSSARLILDDIIKYTNLEKCTWHSFRHGFAVRLLMNNIDIYNISKLMGHSSLDTTAKYLKHNTEEMRLKFKKLGLFA